MANRSLRVVEPGERRREPMSVLEAAESGDRIDELRAMRKVIARAIDDGGTSPRDLAALTRRQIEISREIEALEAAEVQEAQQRERSSSGRRSFAATAI